MHYTRGNPKNDGLKLNVQGEGEWRGRLQPKMTQYDMSLSTFCFLTWKTREEKARKGGEGGDGKAGSMRAVNVQKTKMRNRNRWKFRCPTKLMPSGYNAQKGKRQKPRKKGKDSPIYCFSDGRAGARTGGKRAVPFARPTQFRSDSSTVHSFQGLRILTPAKKGSLSRMRIVRREDYETSGVR